MGAEAQPDTLQAHMKGTYIALRLGIGVIGAALPLVLWFGGRLFADEQLRGSISAYYYSEALRDTFVGALVAIGLLLYLYKGFSTKENVALNLAGGFAVGVAMVPTTPPGVAGGGFTLHATFAVLFFLCIGYVCLFRASDTLSLIREPKRAERIRAVYRMLGLGMVVSPLIAVILTFSLDRRSSVVFFVEAFGVWVFAAYWLVKSSELKDTDAELLALEGKLKAASEPSGAPSAPGRLVQIEPDRKDEEEVRMTDALQRGPTPANRL